MDADVIIDPVIKDMIAPLSADELALLEASLLAEGCREALIAWNDTLIDGHHRFAICQQHGISFRVDRRQFTDIDHVEVWVRRNQAGRRNLTDDQRAANADLLALVEERISKRERAKAGRRAGGKRKPDEDRSGTTAVPKRSKERSLLTAAKRAGVSANRTRRARAIRKKSKGLAKKVLTGEVTIKEAEKALRKQEREDKRKEAATAAKVITADTDATIVHASFADAAPDKATVSLIFTDPPYHDKSLPVYVDLGKVAQRVLKDGGSLITYTSHHRMPEVIQMLQAAGLTFFWPLAMVHGGQKARMTEYGIVVHWKPLLWFVKGKFRSRDDLRFVNDLVHSSPEKAAHPWQQGTTEAKYYIEALTHPGDLVFDPFCGGGTTAVAAAQTLRRWLTCDVDEEAVWIARKRLREAVQG